jgi:diguanylate cyclase (GGDEF)-like protein
MLRHLAAIFALLGFTALNYGIKSWFNKIFLSVQVLCMILLLLPRTMVDLKNLYTWTFIAIAPLPIYLLIQLIQPKNRNSSNGLLLGVICVASILAIRDALLPILGFSAIFLSHYGFSIMILASASFIVSEFINQNQRLATEQIRAARVKEDSMRDPLTGAYNRNIINEVVPSLRGCFSILVFDLNDLKLINDTYGHFAGDEVLKDLAHILNECAIENKIIVRTGGDEFLMILPSLNAEQADHVISDLRARISKSRIKDSNGQGEFKYYASIGFASMQNDAPLDYQAFAKLLDEADQRMYREKERSRHLRIQ